MHRVDCRWTPPTPRPRSAAASLALQRRRPSMRCSLPAAWCVCLCLSAAGATWDVPSADRFLGRDDIAPTLPLAARELASVTQCAIFCSRSQHCQGMKYEGVCRMFANMAVASTGVLEDLSYQRLSLVDVTASPALSTSAAATQPSVPTEPTTSGAGKTEQQSTTQTPVIVTTTDSPSLAVATAMATDAATTESLFEVIATSAAAETAEPTSTADTTYAVTSPITTQTRSPATTSGKSPETTTEKTTTETTTTEKTTTETTTPTTTTKTASKTTTEITTTETTTTETTTTKTTTPTTTPTTKPVIVTTTTSLSCTAPWTKVGERCLQYVPMRVAVGWEDARAHCGQLFSGADLAGIRSHDEFQYVYRHRPAGDQAVAWVGVHYLLGWRNVVDSSDLYGPAQKQITGHFSNVQLSVEYAAGECSLCLVRTARDTARSGVFCEAAGALTTDLSSTSLQKVDS